MPAKLLEVESQKEQDAINKELGVKWRGLWKNQFWIGLSDREGEGEWKWESSSKKIKGLYSNWRQGEPSNGPRENCARMKLVNGIWYWMDKECTSKFMYICERGNWHLK